MFTADQLVAHAVGDYLTQSHWMANEKTLKRNIACLCHGVMYALPFVFLRPGWLSLLAIAFSHYVIDHCKLARYVVYAKNFIAPKWTVQLRPNPNDPGGVPTPVKVYWWHPWSECKETGYHKDVPPYIATWLYIIADNILHILCNAAVIRWL